MASPEQGVSLSAVIDLPGGATKRIEVVRLSDYQAERERREAAQEAWHDEMTRADKATARAQELEAELRRALAPLLDPKHGGDA